MKSITVLVPCYNEESVLGLFYQRLTQIINALEAYRFEILFVNDGSKDNTLSLIKQMREHDERVAFVNLSRNFGKEAAMIAGLDNVHSDAVIIIDADLQDPPELIIQMIAEWENGYQDISAKRRSRKGESFMKRASSKLYYRILERATNVPVQVDVGDYRLLDRQCIDALCSMREGQRYTKGLFSWIGYSKKEILFDRDERAAGETKWDYFKLFGLAVDGITSFTTAPLRMSSVAGVCISAVGFIYMMWILFKTLIYGDPVPGYPSLLCVILFLGGIQLIVLGIIGEYLGRIFNESKQRPLYLVKEYECGKISK